MKTIYLAGGCFWGTEHFIGLVPGVVDTEVGFANSTIESPSYKLVCTGTTGAAETVKVVYDPDTVDLSSLLKMYLLTINPTSLNRQGNDVGTQYRTGIYFTDPSDLPVIEDVLAQESMKYDAPIVVEVKPLQNFYPAEEYHQDYLIKNPDGYCHLSQEIFDFVRSLRR